MPSNSLLEIVHVFAPDAEAPQTAAFQHCFSIAHIEDASQISQLLQYVGLQTRLYPQEGRATLYVLTPDQPDLAEKLRKAHALAPHLQALRQAAAKVFGEERVLTISMDGSKTAYTQLPAARLAKPMADIRQPIAAPQPTSFSKVNEVSATIHPPTMPKKRSRSSPMPDMETESTSKKMLEQSMVQLGNRLTPHISLIIKASMALMVLFVVYLMLRGYMCPDLAFYNQPKHWICKL